MMRLMSLFVIIFVLLSNAIGGTPKVSDYPDEFTVVKAAPIPIMCAG
jgi:hypothetical protein